MEKEEKIFLMFFLPMLAGAAIFALLWAKRPPVRAEQGIVFGVDFSQSQAEYLQLDWKETYLAIINDLGAKNIKLHVNWDKIEPKQGKLDFSDTDWQVAQAEKKGVKLIFVLGMKTGRWPECHQPSWAEKLPQARQKEELLRYVSETVSRYKDSRAIEFWQVENEPLFYFGQCPMWYYSDPDLLKKEVELAKEIDPSRQIIVSDSGEQSDWKSAAEISDILGITTYRSNWPVGTKVWSHFDSYTFLSPETYKAKAQAIENEFGKKVICIELQAEPWASSDLMNAPITEQLNSMNAEMFNQSVDFAKQTGLDTFYFWGAEWWYWMKEKQNRPEIWDAAKNVLS